MEHTFTSSLRNAAIGLAFTAVVLGTGLAIALW